MENNQKQETRFESFIKRNGGKVIGTIVVVGTGVALYLVNRKLNTLSELVKSTNAALEPALRELGGVASRMSYANEDTFYNALKDDSINKEVCISAYQKQAPLSRTTDRLYEAANKLRVPSKKIF